MKMEYSATAQKLWVTLRYVTA